MIDLLSLAASLASGLLAGALLTEAWVLVPYWRSMRSEDFLELHSTIAPLLFRFYATITVAGTLLPIAVGAAQWLTHGDAITWWISSACCGLALPGFYFGFFKQANQQFADGLPPEEQPRALSRWATVHQFRCVFALAGFLFSSVALLTS